MSARILIADIETAPIVAQVWSIWEQNVGLNQIEHDWSILSYCAKWLGEDELFYKDTGGRGVKRVRNDKPLLKDIWTLLDAADIVVAQNGKKFDVRKINARLIQQGFLPYSPIRIIDTATEARKHFGFTSNKLAYLSEKLTDTPKDEHREYPGHELWRACLRDEPGGWEAMRKYNPIDVIATEQVYLRMRPWIAGHPNLAAYDDATKLSCPKCSGHELQFRGVAVSQVGRYRRFQCKSCGGWGRVRANELSKAKRDALLAN